MKHNDSIDSTIHTKQSYNNRKLRGTINNIEQPSNTTNDHLQTEHTNLDSTTTKKDISEQYKPTKKRSTSNIDIINSYNQRHNSTITVHQKKIREMISRTNNNASTIISMDNVTYDTHNYNRQDNNLERIQQKAAYMSSIRHASILGPSPQAYRLLRRRYRSQDR